MGITGAETVKSIFPVIEKGFENFVALLTSSLQEWMLVDATGCILSSKEANREAERIRDEFLSSLSNLSNNQLRKFIAVIAGYNKRTGHFNIAAKMSGEWKDWMNKDEGRKVCVEDILVEQLGGYQEGIDGNIIMTPAIRPRTMDIVLVCKLCQENYTQNNFIPGTQGDPAGVWYQ